MDPRGTPRESMGTSMGPQETLNGCQDEHTRAQGVPKVPARWAQRVLVRPQRNPEGSKGTPREVHGSPKGPEGVPLGTQWAETIVIYSARAI